MKRSRLQFKYESEKIPYTLNKHYIPDFILDTSRGKVYIECKGYFRPEDKSKLRAVKKLHPDLDIRILFYSFRQSYVKWAEKYGFLYAVERIPKEWLI